MNKKLPTDAITNELAGSSVFFQPPTSRDLPFNPPEENDTSGPKSNAVETIPSDDAPFTKPSKQDSTQSRNHAITQSRVHDDKQPPTNNGMTEEHLDVVRKAVKQLGKELSTHRFTTEEKTALAEIIYTYTRQGTRTSENEITRIGVNWLLLDYRQNGENSVLAQLLERLHG